MERNLLLREIEALDVAERDFEGPAVSGEDPNTLVRELAVIPFSEGDRKCLYVAPFNAADNKKKAAQNKSALSKYGVGRQQVMQALMSYVDLDVLKRAITQLSSGTPLDDDSVLTEAVHQFQAKVFSSTSEWDGVVGPSVLSSLGFIFHKAKVFSASKANASIRSVFSSKGVASAIEAHKSALEIPALAQITGARWFHYIINPAILGWNGNNSGAFMSF